MQQALDAITKACETGEGNLLELAIEAAKHRATLGEISYAMEKAWGRYTPEIKSITGVYSSEISQNENFRKAQQLADEF